jgi:hypothetical protein
MDKIKEFFKKPISFGLVGLIVGIFIGLVVLGWGLWPLQWVDASPSALQMDYQRDYLCMMIDSYIRNQDDSLVQLRWGGLGEKSADLLNTLTPAVCRFESDDEIKAFKQFMGVMPQAQSPTAEEGDQVISPSPSLVPEIQAENTFSIMPLMILMVLTLAVGGVFLFLMKRKSAGSNPQKVKTGKPVRKQEEPQSHETANVSNKPALAQFMTTYRQGDDLYDDSFSIDSVNGEFLGECGVGVAETIGVGEPKKVTALEVWLFDKNDIQTVTKVLLSEHANKDSSIRQRLLSKGEPVEVAPGMRFVMETASLQMEARVIDLVYARGPLPENSYFSRVTLEIQVWSK